MGILSWMFAGLIAGWLGRFIMIRDSYGLIVDMITGMFGGMLGGCVAFLLLHIGTGFNDIKMDSLLMAFFTAMILLILVRILRNGQRILFRFVMHLFHMSAVL